ncbi:MULTISPECIES: preprotein translocase subunit SecE [Weeksella]|uniref:Protein translocase subunit SecE n=1 Tax=Weeksella virosa (strain ATCC 43766 / DSM 16922 / JCM 21250 / CCUG 30538 / CDC 9751 / IAM 14551 / NBRC 16016 / NCTC 11634 / CL345/78) TaxID=865938 RepID=F0P0F7_WEEVC|nr:MULTISPECIES: preprotein translocase subunit SecE [Weeksella]ADX67441.1 preprotein translocase, SecE subunit [Weeksella virosa DSM 16922]MDK7374331.1 preprotein translocase subunit SecE [Weeksella virosa]MDK7675722.1 preprotein translocase subunit SecE [Weeksella virosa]OFM81922.1 preprotein translocase subunit SecE [Weeksella sp. HMSC059D05]VEH62817.1 preprotein translocase subunit SecE [Weeksella virosa]
MKVVNFIKSSFVEFKENVTWPSFQDLQKDTIIVTIATVLLAIFLYIIDSVFAKILYNIYETLR